MQNSVSAEELDKSQNLLRIKKEKVEHQKLIDKYSFKKTLWRWLFLFFSCIFTLICFYM
jgi:hypothetical protein